MPFFVFPFPFSPHFIKFFPNLGIFLPRSSSKTKLLVERPVEIQQEIIAATITSETLIIHSLLLEYTAEILSYCKAYTPYPWEKNIHSSSSRLLNRGERNKENITNFSLVLITEISTHQIFLPSLPLQNTSLMQILRYILVLWGNLGM